MKTVLKNRKVYLDPLVEVEQNWLVPLIDPISRNYKIVTEPFIDKICPYTFQLKVSLHEKSGLIDNLEFVSEHFIVSNWIFQLATGLH